MATKSLSSLRRFAEGGEGQRVWVGVDVHKRNYHVALRREDGDAIAFVSPPDPPGLIRQLKGLGISLAGLAYEAGPTGFSLAREAMAQGITTLVAAPSRIPRPVTPGAKTDRIDCVKLADLCAKGMIPPVTVPTPTEESRRALLRRRHQLADALRRTKQRIKGMLLFHGLSEPPAVEAWSKDAPEALRSLPLEPSAGQAMESHLREFAFAQSELKVVMAEISLLESDPDHREVVGYMRTVPGIGPVVASSFALEIFRPERFNHGDEVSSYVGLAPMVRQTGNKTSRGRLRPVGQTRLRSLLIEAAWMWKSKDAQAAAIYRKLLARTGIPQKAITALARRLAVILWRISVERRPYRMATV
jgi:transposase